MYLLHHYVKRLQAFIFFRFQKLDSSKRRKIKRKKIKQMVQPTLLFDLLRFKNDTDLATTNPAS